jgi:hypothetical protein
MDASKHTSAKELFDRWDKDVEFREEYNALEGQFALGGCSSRLASTPT